MQKQQDIDVMIESFVERERKTRLNPFLSTRVMASISGEKKGLSKFRPAWQNIAMALGVVAAIIAGIKTGSLYRPSQTKGDRATITIINDDQMENFVFYQQSANE